MKFKDLPNLLSIIRIIMVPIFVYLFLCVNIPVAIAVFILAGATDVLDGYIARKYGFVSNLGKILDPLADKMLQLAAFICLGILKYIPMWMPIIYFSKELLTSVGALFIFRKRKLVVISNFFGKFATVLVFGAVFAISLFHEQLGKLGTTAICIVVAVYFVFSCTIYAIEYLKKR